eukprot:TRINITY_DN11623_c0_g1_i1.p1 TRINITY_DN11623_c0_g1~~TRINITY_DN11623_c0_g1_i1.p1  ORF type:complete len:186 (+),score=19.41 TRINITY_DN11623_c0_g1_i1:57-560(+)
MAAAVIARQFECFRYLYDNGCPITSTLLELIQIYGDIPFYKFAEEELGSKPGRLATFSAAKRGSLECLQYLHETGNEWDPKTCVMAAASGSLACLKYAHENGCEWDAKVCTTAATWNHLECLKYAHEHGCPWGEETTRSAWKSKSNLCLQYAVENGCPHSVLDEQII